MKTEIASHLALAEQKEVENQTLPKTIVNEASAHFYFVRIIFSRVEKSPKQTFKSEMATEEICRR